MPSVLTKMLVTGALGLGGKQTAEALRTRRSGTSFLLSHARESARCSESTVVTVRGAASLAKDMVQENFTLASTVKNICEAAGLGVGFASGGGQGILSKRGQGILRTIFDGEKIVFDVWDSIGLTEGRSVGSTLADLGVKPGAELLYTARAGLSEELLRLIRACDDEITFCAILKAAEAGKADLVHAAFYKEHQRWGCRVREFHESLKSNRKVMLAVVRKNGLDLQHAADELKSDKEVVLAAVGTSGSALMYASLDLQGDDEVVEAALKNDDSALEHAHIGLVLEMVKEDGMALQRVSDALQRERRVVLQAVRQSGLALQYASKDLKSDRGVVLQAVKQDVSALKYASKSLLQDEEFLLEAEALQEGASKFAKRQLANAI